MPNLELMWPAIILIGSIALVFFVRLAISEGDRRTRARYRSLLDELRGSQKK